MSFPLPWSSGALGAGAGRSKSVRGTSHVLRCYQLSALKGQASQTGVEGLTGAFDPSSFWWAKGLPLWGRQV